METSIRHSSMQDIQRHLVPGLLALSGIGLIAWFFATRPARLSGDAGARLSESRLPSLPHRKVLREAKPREAGLLPAASATPEIIPAADAVAVTPPAALPPEAMPERSIQVAIP